MRALRNEKGLALLSTLMMLVLGFGVVAMLLRLVTAESKLAGMEQGYTTALDAGKSAADMFLYLVQNSLDNPPNTIGAATTPNSSCIQIKRTKKTSEWTGAGWDDKGCPSIANATNPDPTVFPDVTMTLANCIVKFKIINTTLTAAPVPAPPSGTPCELGCIYYTVNVRSVSTNKEQADLSFVYRYDQ